MVPSGSARKRIFYGLHESLQFFRVIRPRQGGHFFSVYVDELFFCHGMGFSVFGWSIAPRAAPSEKGTDAGINRGIV
jgi:hypothetical protein